MVGYYGWLPLIKIKNNVAGFESICVNFQLALQAFLLGWGAKEDQGMGFFQCFALFVALDHYFCMGKTPKKSHSMLPNPTEMLATWADFLISMGYQALCVTTIYVTPA